MGNQELITLRDEMKSELYNNIIPFWTKETINKDNGGFWSTINNTLDKRTDSPKSLIIYTRLLWTYSAWHRFDANPLFLDLAQRAFNYLSSHFWDHEYKGAFWSLDENDNVLDDKKKVYGHSFLIYALSEFYAATKNEQALEIARITFKMLEEIVFDNDNAGYFEAYNRDWSLAEDLRLSDKDMNEKKSMNTHLHILEAYTNLYRVWPDDAVKEKLIIIIDIFQKHIIDSNEKRFKLFFDEKWNCKSPYTSYGHDIEGSWLIWEAAEVLGDEQLLNELKPVAVAMARRVIDTGIDDDGGVFYEGKGSEIIDSDKHWWPQAEAIVGFINAWQLSGDADFIQQAVRVWEFTKKHIIDHDHGEWFWKVSKDRVPDMKELKVDYWKGPYHNSRACMEIINRLSSIK